MTAQPPRVAAGLKISGPLKSSSLVELELGHVLEIMLNEQGYYLQACFDVPASLVHCADYYGYETGGSYHTNAWLDDFFSEYITQEAWDVLEGVEL